MYLQHFGLHQAPFGITPNPAFFFDGSSRGAILEALLYAVGHGEGIIKVTGEVGSGKTMLCRTLESMLPEHVEVIYLVNPTLSREEVIYAIAGELGLAATGKRADEVIRMLHSDLIAKHVAGKQVVLLIEEAQAMPLDTLEEIRLFSNLETASHKLLQIIMFGQPELDESLALPRMRQLKERITHSFKVPPLPKTVILDFLMFRMRTAGYRGPDIFTGGAVNLISSASEGIVRRINILADKALLAAFADDKHFVHPKYVKQAIQDSEFATTAKRRRWQVLGPALLASVVLVVTAASGWMLFKAQVIRSGPMVIFPAALVEASVTPGIPVTAGVPVSALAPSPVLPSQNTVAAPEPIASQDAGPVQSAATIAAEESTPGSLPTSLPTPDSHSGRLTASKLWLSEQAESHYTLQLTSVPADKRVELAELLQQIDAQLGANDIHVFPSIALDAEFGILYGRYATRAEAVTKRNALIKKWGYQPRLRTIGGVRSEITRSQSESLWESRDIRILAKSRAP